MNKKKYKSNNSDKPHPVAKKQAANAIAAEANEYWKQRAVLFVIILLTCIALLPALKNSFVWDDDIYIVKNNLITDISWKGIKEMFTDFSSDNYGPVTVFINAVQYNIAGLDPAVFHLGSLIFHILNVILVFWFVRKLSHRWELAAIVALLFGIHPTQVESIAWASGGSTLYSGTFRLASLLAYLYYLKDTRIKYLAMASFFFLLAMLSKAVAVEMPLLFLLMDYIKGRKITGKVLLEKLPLFALSVAFGILAFILKNQDGSVSTALPSFPIRIVVACYGFVMYIARLVFPVHLSAFYPYPSFVNGAIPFQFYLYALLALVILAGAFYTLRYTKEIIFGMGFFALTIFLLLQLMPTGGAVMADRYSYLSSIGIFYMAGEGLLWLWNRQWKIPAVAILTVFTVFYSVKTYSRCTVWNNAMTLWSDVITQEPEVPMAYYNRGIFFMKQRQDNEHALADYSKAIELKPDYAEAYNNRGVILMNEKRYNEALDDYRKALDLKERQKGKKLFQSLDTDEINENYAHTYNFRGILYFKEHKYDEAIADYTKAIELKPEFANAYYNRGVTFYLQNKFEEAISDYSKAISLKADYGEAFFNRGLAEYYCQKHNMYCDDLREAAALGYKDAEKTLAQICK
jgi:tetratricopeptide (TPR) repeat protein